MWSFLIFWVYTFYGQRLCCYFISSFLLPCIIRIENDTLKLSVNGWRIDNSFLNLQFSSRYQILSIQTLRVLVRTEIGFNLSASTLIILYLLYFLFISLTAGDWVAYVLSSHLVTSNKCLSKFKLVNIKLKCQNLISSCCISSVQEPHVASGYYAGWHR